MTGLYAHVPFCEKKCHYCNFVIAPAGRAADRAAFFGAFEREAARRAPEFRDTVFDTVYLGGGTPSVLEPAEFEALGRILRSHFRWKGPAEITIEVNPNDVDAARASAWRAFGANRASLGAQSFHDDTLRKLNRAHGSADITAAFKHLRDAGFSNISVDLILSLPGEPWKRALASLERLAELGPEHVSIYELAVEEKTVFGDMHKKGALALPGEDEQFDILSNARDFLKRHGWRHYELLSYARPGFESRHNSLYWANEPTLGLGPGAWSYLGGRRSRSSESYAQYLEKASRGDWEPVEQESLDADRSEAEAFVLSLRLAEGAPQERFAAVIGRLREEIGGLEEKGLLTCGDGRIRLTERGQFLAETVFTELSC